MIVLSNYNSFEEGSMLSCGRLGKLIADKSVCEKTYIYMILQKLTPPPHILMYT